MTLQPHNITLGTAGHVDHGKTALVKLLTGCDTDRLKIEKERGMSIELGFAPCRIANLEVGIVDVPGHENFVKTMVAGASGIDGCILVVAADDGVMPQTREHLDILTLLGVEHGIVAMTKVDAVPPERTPAAAQEIRQFVTGTFLQEAPILPISNITGQGFEEFYEALKAMVGRIVPKTAGGVFRVPVERAFAVKGYGTIVAGIPTCGTITLGDEVELLPQQKKGRVRAIQVYGRDSTHARAGQCAAINIPQWDPKDIQRGNVVTVGDYFAPHRWYLCELKLLESEKTDLKNGTRVKFHTGTSESTVGVYLFQPEGLTPGRQCLIQVHLNDPMIAGPRDRFILRSLSPTRTLGGGIIVEALDRRLKRTHPEVLADIAERAQAVAKPKSFVEYCVKTAPTHAADEKQLSLRTKTPLTELAPLLTELATEGRILALRGKVFLHIATAHRVRSLLLDTVRQFHRRRPESPGIPREQLMTDGAIRKDVFDMLVEHLRTEGKLVERKGCLALPEHREQINNAEQQLVQNVETMFQSRPFDPPGLQEIADKMRMTPAQLQRVIRILSEQQRIVRVEQDLYFHAEAVAAAKAKLVAYIHEHGGMESVKFKYLLDTTRKFAIPLLDYFDKIGVTRRVGYTRLLK